MTTTTAPTQLDQENPWPGLESFKENAHEFFYGRDQEAQSLLTHVLDAPVTVLYGRSGLGKTSLLQAGLFPELRDRDFLPIYVRFALKPGAAPLFRQLHRSVRHSIRADVPDAVLPSDDESLWEYLHGADFELWSAQNYPLTPVIVLDQFEELFTLGERVSRRVHAFRDELGDLAENRIPAELAARIDADAAVAERFNLRSRNYKLLITLREDFLPHLEEWCRLIPALGRSRVRLLPLQAEQALDAVRKPAGHLMTDDLARRVVDIIDGEDLHLDSHAATSEIACSGDHGTEEVEPALLSLFCRELNEERKRRGQSHFDEVLVEDAKRDILSNYYSSCVGELPPRVAEFIESELITEKGFRDSYVREDAVPAHLTEDELAQLISSRLLRLEDRYGAQRIELTHDVLTGVVREHRDRRRAEDEKAALAAHAEQERQALEQAAAEREAELDRERRVGRRLRWLSVVLAMVCVAALVLAVVTWRSMQSAERANQAVIEASHETLAEGLSSQAQVMLLSDHSGSEFEAITDLLAAQHISPTSDIGGQLTALVVTEALKNVVPTSSDLSADGRRAAAQTPSGIQILDAETGEAVGDAFANTTVRVSGISWDGHYVAVAGTDGAIQVWDTITGLPKGPPIHDSGQVFRRLVPVTTDGRHVVTAESNFLTMWDVERGQKIKTLPLQDLALVTAIAFSPDGRRLAAGDMNGKIRLWDGGNGTPLRDLTVGGESGGDGGTERAQWIDSHGIAFSPDGGAVAAGVDVNPGGTQLRIWNANTGDTIATQDIKENGDVAVAFSPDGARVVTGIDTTEQQWDARGNPIGPPLRFRAPVSQVAFNQRGDRIVSAFSQTLQVSDSNPNSGLAAEVGGSRAAHLGSGETPFAVHVFAERTRIATVQADTLRWLDVDTGDQIGTAVVSDALRGIGSFDLSPDGRWLALAGVDNDVRIISTATGQLYGPPMKGHTDTVTSVTFSPDGTTLVSGSADKTIRLWDWRAGHPAGDPMAGHESGIDSVVFSTDGNRVYSRSRDSIRFWDRATHHPVGTAIRGSNFTTWASSPDGQRIAAVDGETIQQWNTESGEPIGQPIPAHFNTATDIEYNSDGRYLVSVGMDATLRFWNARTGKPAGTPVPTNAVGLIQDVTLSKDDRRVFISAMPGRREPGSGGIWEVPGPAAWHDMLCAKLASNPTETEWKQWVSPDPEVKYATLCPDKPDRP